MTRRKTHLGRYSREETLQYIRDLGANIEGAAYELGRLAAGHPRGVAPEEIEISSWKEAGRPDEFRGFPREMWELANEVRKHKRSLRKALRELG